jgi:hypothetical protein
MQRVLCAIVFVFTSCNQAAKPRSLNDAAPKIGDTQQLQLPLSDTPLLHHEAGLFYRSKNGHLFMHTLGQREDSMGHLQDFEYLNGMLPQGIDAETFKELDGWYAKDKNHVYFFRPISGGTEIQTIHDADYSTFKVLEGHYLFAVDKNHLYSLLRNNWIDSLNPSRTKVIRDSAGQIIAFVEGAKIYHPD